jgi:gluconolactonase
MNEPLITTIEIFDERLRPVVAGAPQLERLCTGARWSEGPVWMAEDDSVLWSDIPNDRMLRWSAADGMRVWRERAEFTNGHARDQEGSMLHFSHGLRAVFRTAPDGSDQRIVVERWQGKRFNAPNDIVVKSDGTLWFTDPPYGLIIPEEGHGGVSEIGDCHVFRFDPAAGALDPVTDLPVHPNGLAFSTEERLLYVSDTSGALPEHGSNASGCSTWTGPEVAQRPRVCRRRARRAGRVPPRPPGLALHEFAGQRPGLPPGRDAAGQDPGAGKGRQCHVRRTRAGRPLHRGVDVAVPDPAGHARRAAAVSRAIARVRPDARGAHSTLMFCSFTTFDQRSISSRISLA